MAGMGMGAAPMGGPPMGPPMGAPVMAPPDPTDSMIQQLQLLFQKWGSGEQQIAGEKGALDQMLSMLLGAQAPTAAQAFAEPGMGGGGMMPPPMDAAPIGQGPMMPPPGY